MKQITLQDFKSLISGMTADEMIDMMPKTILDNVHLYIGHTHSTDFGIFYVPMGEKPLFYIVENAFLYVRDCTETTLLRLFTNNYLPSYQLLQDSLQENN